MRLEALLGWLCLVVLLGLSLAPAERSQQGPDDISRLLAYSLANEPIRFAIEPGERAIKLLTWYSRPARWAPDPRAVSSYRLHAELVDEAGAVLLDQDIWVSTRFSRTLSQSGALEAPTTRADTDWEVADEVWTHLMLPEGLEQRAILSISAPSIPTDAPGEILGVAFRQARRGTLARLRVLYGGAPGFRERSTERVGLQDWSELPLQWRSNLAALRWERLGALPGEGDVGSTIPLLTSWKRTTFEDAPAVGMPLLLGTGLVYNITGPARFEATWTELDGVTPARRAALFEVVRPDGSLESQMVPSTTKIGPLWIKDGVQSVRVRLMSGEAPALLVVREKTIAEGHPWGVPAVIPEADGWLRVGPELTSRESYRVGPEAPLAVPLESGELLRLTVTRPLVRSQERGAAQMSITVKDTAGETVLEDVVALSDRRSPWERYVEGTSFEDSWVSEPVYRYVQAPAGGGRVVVNSPVAADVSARVRRPRALVLQEDDPAYALPDGAGLYARYTPDEAGRWVRRLAAGHEDIARAGRLVRVDLQVRLEPRGEHDGSGPLRTLELGPLVDLVYEPDRDGDPGAGARARLSTTSSAVLVDASGLVTIDYQVPPSAIGRAFPVTVDGVTTAYTAVTSNGRWRLRTEPGTRRIAVDGEGLFFARGPGSVLWNSRRVWRHDGGETLQLDVPPGPQKVLLYVYATGGEPRVTWGSRESEARAQLYAEAPPDDRGYNELQRTSEALLMSRDGQPVGVYGPLTVRFAEGGSRELSLTIDGLDEAWVRLATTWAQPDSANAERAVRILETP